MKLIRLLQEHPDICVSLDTPAPCIDAYSVAPWRDYEMFVISDATPIRRGFHDAMEAFRATWLGHSMPRPFQNTQAIMLPKAERRSMQLPPCARRSNAVHELIRCHPVEDDLEDHWCWSREGFYVG